MRYSGWKVFTEGLLGNKGWTRAWRDPAPKAEYDAIIIGGGGHGLATAYYLAKNHGMTNIAVLEKGYLGGGNVGRNTTIVRANWLVETSTKTTSFRDRGSTMEGPTACGSPSYRYWFCASHSDVWTTLAQVLQDASAYGRICSGSGAIHALFTCSR